MLCAIFGALGVGTVSTELVRLVTWRPVSATVVSAEVRREHGKRHPTFRPVVLYRYEFAGREYESDRVTPIAYASGHEWAVAVAGAYQPGERTTAYVNPANPSAAYLIHAFDAHLVPMLAIPFGVLAVIAAMARLAALQSTPTPRYPATPIFGSGVAR